MSGMGGRLAAHPFKELRGLHPNAGSPGAWLACRCRVARLCHTAHRLAVCGCARTNDNRVRGNNRGCRHNNGEHRECRSGNAQSHIGARQRKRQEQRESDGQRTHDWSQSKKQRLHGFRVVQLL
jgi:hypothetical protein